MRIFISYRRGISSGWAGRLAEKLKAQFGAKNVFVDVETLLPGVDFVEAISSALRSSDVLLTIIAPDWIEATTSGGRRLDDPEDFVRIEISLGLARGVRVIPVLVGGAAMPNATDLPEDLRPLARRQAHELSDTRWDFDCQRLIAVLRGTAEEGPELTPERDPVTPASAADDAPRVQARRRRLLPMALMLAIVLIFSAAFLVWRLVDNRAASSPKTETFAFPTLEGYRVDVCLSWGNDCGQPAADEFCKRQGFAEAAGFDTEIVGERRMRTKLIGTGQICDVPQCAAFTRIDCR